MPIARKTSSTGAPMRREISPATMLSSPSAPPSKISLCDRAIAAWPSARSCAPVMSRAPAWLFANDVGRPPQRQKSLIRDATGSITQPPPFPPPRVGEGLGRGPGSRLPQESSMANIEIQVNAVEPFAEGQPFGEAGSYLRIRGVAKGELDPAAPENRVIVDLDKAPRNERGLVEYETDFFILRPADPSRTSGVLVYDVTNRGSKRILQRLDDAPGDPPAAANDLRTVREAGTGFLLGRGYRLVWSGWDPGAPTANNGLGARFPTATENGRPVTGQIRHEFHIGTRAPGKSDLVRLPYPAISTDTRRARLTVRDRESETRIEIPADTWEFADAQSIRLLPQDSL